MVLDEPLDVDEDLIPSFSNGADNILQSDVTRSQNTISVIEDYEKIVVPRMIDLDWMSKAAKSRSKPYYNNTEQNLNAHILPGVEILADIVEQSPKIENSSFRDLVSLWTIHDIHKIIKSDDGEFSISKNQTNNIVNKLELNQFNNKLEVDDYHSCAVALHNSPESHLDDSSVRFTQLRPVLRLVDAVSSISDPVDFIDQAEKEVMNVFSTDEKKYVPGCHKVEFDDSITKMVVNKTIYKKLKKQGYIPIDIREDGVLYARPNNPTDIENNTGDVVEDICERTIQNFRSGYQSFSNQSLLGSNIENPQSRANYNKPPRVYDVSSLSKVCLDKEELIQRIVQAAVKQQNIPYDLPKESKNQIKSINDNLNANIEKSTFVEGMAALVHTVYKDIVPRLVDKNSSNWFEKTMESALVRIFECSSRSQELLIEAMECKDINASPMEWPYKYIVAQELHDKYTTDFSRTERQKEMTKLILENISNFDGWESFTSYDVRDFIDEMYIQVGSKCYINESKLSEFKNVDLIRKIDKQEKEGNCDICNTATAQSPISPLLLSHNNFDILERDFVMKKNVEMKSVDISDTIPKKPICIPCQVGLSIRSQQFNSFKQNKNKNLHVSVHPVNSGSAASLVRFNKILNILQKRVFTDESTLDYYNMGSEYKEIIQDYLEQDQNLKSITDRERILDIASRRDAATSLFKIPDDSPESRIKSICCISIAALISGVKACITTQPQMHINHSNSQDIVTFGPRIKEFEDLINTRPDAIGFPRKVKIIDRVIRIGELTNSTDYCIKKYSGFEDESILPGSRIYDKISHIISEERELRNIVDKCVNIDVISSEKDVFARELLVTSSNIGKALSNCLNCSDPDKIEDSVDTLFEELSKDCIYNKNDFDRLVREKIITNDSGDSIEDYSSSKKLSEHISSLYAEYSDGEGLGDLRIPVKNSIFLQAVLESKREGDKNV
jgi:CRISPR type I-D-associated protein Csc3/Cas10d